MIKIVKSTKRARKKERERELVKKNPYVRVDTWKKHTQSYKDRNFHTWNLHTILINPRVGGVTFFAAPASGWGGGCAENCCYHFSASFHKSFVIPCFFQFLTRAYEYSSFERHPGITDYHRRVILTPLFLPNCLLVSSQDSARSSILFKFDEPVMSLS